MEVVKMKLFDLFFVELETSHPISIMSKASFSSCGLFFSLAEKSWILMQPFIMVQKSQRTENLIPMSSPWFDHDPQVLTFLWFSLLRQ